MFHCNVGLMQGEALSPFLFSIYINDFKERIKEFCEPVDLQDISCSFCFCLFACLFIYLKLCRYKNESFGTIVRQISFSFS